MRYFIRKLLVFLLPLLVFGLAIDLGISYLLRQSNAAAGEYEVWSDIYDSKINSDIAIYGSSRAWVHIDPQILKDSLNTSAYNFGIDGHNFWLQYLRHLEYLKHNKPPKQILFSVDIFTLEKRNDLYKPDQFLPYMLWNTNVAKYTTSYNGYNRADYYIPLIRYAGKIDALDTSLKILFKGAPKNKTRHNGYAGMDKVWNADFEKAKENNTKYEAQIDTASKALFEKFIKECKASNIDLVLVYAPEYFEGQKFVSNRAEVINIYKEFATRYNLVFYDYSNDKICFDKNLFYNASHLNKKGAEIFTRELAHDLKERR